MCLRRCVFPVLLLAGALFRVALCSFAGAETAGIDFYGAPDKGVAPLEVHFHYFGDEAVTQRITGWRWDFGDGAASTENYTTHEYANPGTYTVTLTVTFADGTTQTQTKEKCVTVTSGPAAESSPEEAEQGPPEASESPGERPAAEEARSGGDDVLFIHHSCGENWLNSGLHEALLAKDYVDERNDITYGVDMAPDAGRPDSLGPVPGDLTGRSERMAAGMASTASSSSRAVSRTVISRRAGPSPAIRSAIGRRSPTTKPCIGIPKGLGTSMSTRATHTARWQMSLRDTRIRSSLP